MNFVNRFVREAILRQTRRKYGVMYRLNDGKFYKSIVSAYSYEQAERMIRQDPSNWAFHEYKPNEYYQKLIKLGKGVYIYDSIKDED